MRPVKHLDPEEENILATVTVGWINRKNIPKSKTMMKMKVVLSAKLSRITEALVKGLIDKLRFFLDASGLFNAAVQPELRSCSYFQKNKQTINNSSSGTCVVP